MSTAEQILRQARERAELRERSHVPPDYKAANVKFRQQKAALTRAVNSGDRAKVVLAVKKARDEWSRPPFNGAWPDDWSRWQRALDDVTDWRQRVDIRDL